MNITHPAVLPSHAQLARENEALRQEVRRWRSEAEYDAVMFARLAESLVGFRTTAGMGATMRVRADRLNKLLNAAPATGAAESEGVRHVSPVPRQG